MLFQKRKLYRIKKLFSLLAEQKLTEDGKTELDLLLWWFRTRDIGDAYREIAASTVQNTVETTEQLISLLLVSKPQRLKDASICFYFLDALDFLVENIDTTLQTLDEMLLRTCSFLVFLARQHATDKAISSRIGRSIYFILLDNKEIQNTFLFEQLSKNSVSFAIKNIPSLYNCLSVLEKLQGKNKKECDFLCHLALEFAVQYRTPRVLEIAGKTIKKHEKSTDTSLFKNRLSALMTKV